MDRIRIDLQQRLGTIDRNLFGGFLEHVGRAVYGGVLDPGSPRSDAEGLRTDVVAALARLSLANIRYPGGNFASGYRWMDGVGPVEERATRLDLAWDSIDDNSFGTNEFIALCRRLRTEPYLVTNCGDGDLREARDWVEYCNGTRPTALTKLRERHGHPEPHRVRYWAVGNEVDGPWQIGTKTPSEYARVFLEFAKAMRWVDPTIKLVASATSDWDGEIVERAQLLAEQARDHIDYISIHWYVGDRANDYLAYMAVSELLEERLSAYEGLMRALALGRHPRPPIPIAVDEWNAWYRTTADPRSPEWNGLDEVYDLQDALVVAMHLNAFIRHADSVRMANLAQLVNGLAAIRTTSDELVLQTIFYPFELYARTAGNVALDVWWDGETFSGGDYAGVRTLDVAASLDEGRRTVTVWAVNRSLADPHEIEVRVDGARPTGEVRVSTINGPDVRSENSIADPHRVGTGETTVPTAGREVFNHTLEPHSVTALVFQV